MSLLISEDNELLLHSLKWLNDNEKDILFTEWGVLLDKTFFLYKVL